MSRQQLIDVIRHYNRLIEKLDYELVPLTKIEQDEQVVGGFVSRLNLTKTAEEIVEEACGEIRRLKAAQKSCLCWDKEGE